jgi:hypothetical protein
MSKVLDDSLKLYEEIKKFFYDAEEYDFVIEMSDRPMSEWKLIYIISYDEMDSVRFKIIDQGKGFAGFYNFEGHYHYYFTDDNLSKSEHIDTGEIVVFDDRKFNEFNLKKVAEELRLLQGS